MAHNIHIQAYNDLYRVVRRCFLNFVARNIALHAFFTANFYTHPLYEYFPRTFDFVHLLAYFIVTYSAAM